MQDTDHIELILKKHRIIVIAGAVAVAAIAWGYMVYVAQRATEMDMSMGMTMGNAVSYTHLTLPTIYSV